MGQGCSLGLVGCACPAHGPQLQKKKTPYQSLSANMKRAGETHITAGVPLDPVPRFAFLSATIPNALEFAQWVAQVRGGT